MPWWIMSILSAGAVDLPQELAAALAHHNQPVGEFAQVEHHAVLVGVRLAQHRVQGRDDRHAQLAEQRQHVPSRRPAEDAVLVLQADQIHVVDVLMFR
jgi:hypothetical protein